MNSEWIEGYKYALELVSRRMYHKCFLEGSDMQKWDSGCWIRYKLFENIVDELMNEIKEIEQRKSNEED